jgi:hypothetical protein
MEIGAAQTDPALEPDLDLIEAACRRLHEAASSAAAAAGIGDGVLVLASFPDPKNAAFEIGDWNGMAARAHEWACHGQRNVYFALAIYRGGVVSDRSRGAERDILAVFGVGADLDRDKDNRLEIDHLPIRPSIDVLSSGTNSAGAANHNLILLFDRAVPASEARELAYAFGTLVGDQAPNRGDPGHLWRLPGTLNWPTAAKIKRGRSATPVLVGMCPAGPQVSVEAVRQILAPAAASAPECAREHSSKQEEKGFDAAAAKAMQAAEQRHSDAGWGGDPLEAVRLVEALTVLPNDGSRADWRRRLHQIAGFFPGHECGRRIAEGWSRGGLLKLSSLFTADELEACAARARAKKSALEAMIRNGVTIPPYAGFDQAEFDREWGDAVEHTHGRIGQLFTDAAERGWSTARTPWGLGRVRNPKPLSAEAIAVQAAGREMVATGQAIDRLRSAWLSQVTGFYDGCAHVISVAHVLSRHFSSEKGFAWPSYERVAAMLGWSQKSPAAGYERVRKAVARLAHDQYLVTTDGRGRGAHGWRGGSYAPWFPDATWAEVMAHDAAVFEARTGTDVRPMLLPPPGPQRVSVGAKEAVVDTPTQQTATDHAAVDVPTQETTASRSKDRVRRSDEEDVASKGQDQGPMASARRQHAKGEPAPGAPEAQGPPAPSHTLLHWSNPASLQVPGADRLLEAMEAAAVSSGAHPHEVVLRQAAENVGKLLWQLQRLRHSTDRLSRDLAHHDLELETGLRDRHRPKKPQILAWQKAYRGELPEGVLGQIHYLVSISDKLSAVANSLERWNRQPMMGAEFRHPEAPPTAERTDERAT